MVSCHLTEPNYKTTPLCAHSLRWRGGGGGSTACRAEKIDDVGVTCRGETHPDTRATLSAHVREGSGGPRRPTPLMHLRGDTSKPPPPAPPPAKSSTALLRTVATGECVDVIASAPSHDTTNQARPISGLLQTMDESKIYDLQVLLRNDDITNARRLNLSHLLC